MHDLFIYDILLPPHHHPSKKCSIYYIIILKNIQTFILLILKLLHRIILGMVLIKYKKKMIDLIKA